MRIIELSLMTERELNDYRLIVKMDIEELEQEVEDLMNDLGMTKRFLTSKQELLEKIEDELHERDKKTEDH